MALEVVDADEGDAAREGERLAGREPDEERADEPGAGRRGDEADVRRRPSRPRRAPPRRLPAGSPGARAPRSPARRRRRGVRRDLRGDDVGEHAALAVEDGDGGLVAGGLDAEDDHDGERTGKPSLRAASRSRSSRQTKGSDFGSFVADDESGRELQSVGGAERVRVEKPQCARAGRSSSELTSPPAFRRAPRIRRRGLVLIGRRALHVLAAPERRRSRPPSGTRRSAPVLLAKGADGRGRGALRRAADTIAELSQYFIARTAAPPGAPREGSNLRIDLDRRRRAAPAADLSAARRIPAAFRVAHPSGTPSADGRDRLDARDRRVPVVDDDRLALADPGEVLREPVPQLRDSGVLHDAIIARYDVSEAQASACDSALTIASPRGRRREAFA